jgi:predicted enzyme related to lactoylglutathione lyase
MKKMGNDTNALNWFEIPMTDVARAKKFYETIFEIEMFGMTMGGMEMIMFPMQAPHSGGGLAKSEYHTPSMTGSLVYLNANPDLQLVLDRIENAGGKIVMPKTKISDDIGAMAMFTDSEGNIVALHSSK